MSKAKLTASEWELVKNAPYWVNQMLAEADGRVSFFIRRRESKALEQALKKYKTGNALIKDIIADESDASKEIEKASGADAEKTLNRIATIVEEKLGADDLAELRDFLLKVGREIAESSMEGGTGKIGKVSDKESVALARLESAMKVSTSFATAHMAQPQPAAKPSASAKPAAPAGPVERDDDKTQKKAEQEKNLIAARERQEKAREETEARKKVEAEERLEKTRKEAEERQRQAEAEAKAEADRKEAEAKAAAEKQITSASKYTQFIAEHTVQPGDNLSFISERYYGTQANFRIIYEANKDVIGENMNLIRPGQVLRIPKL